MFSGLITVEKTASYSARYVLVYEIDEESNRRVTFIIVLFFRFMCIFFMFQRLMPVDSGSDLFVYKAPEVPHHKLYSIRPYSPEDEAAVYTVCRKTCLDGLDGTEMFSEYPNLAPERYDSFRCHIFLPETRV